MCTTRNILVPSLLNVGRVNAAELATYIVEKGKPFARSQVSRHGSMQILRSFSDLLRKA